MRKYQITSKVSSYKLQTNHEEIDTQIYSHVMDTVSSTVHIRSVDHDIAMVGLPLICKFGSKQVFLGQIFWMVPSISKTGRSVLWHRLQ